MDETNRNSMKLDIEAVRLSAAEEIIPKESYKALPEVDHSDGLDNGSAEIVKNSNMVREKVDPVEDGADEKMLDAANAGDEKAKLAKKDEIKFITGDHVNGDAKIDIGIVDKSFAAMTKDELMKFSNDPFWVRLRWILFVLFWALWVAMLVGAILIIIDAPKCAAPVPLPWYKQGPFVAFDSCKDAVTHVQDVKAAGARGVICELPGTKTYAEKNSNEFKEIQECVEHYKKEDINVILDVTPNYVDRDSEIYKNAQAHNDYSAFVHYNKEAPPQTWKAKDHNGSAWAELSGDSFLLQQFGENVYDIRMDNADVRESFKKVLRDLAGIGVMGFRLSNAKHYIVGEIKDERPVGGDPAKYESFTHQYSTYQEKLDELLNDFRNTVQNATNDKGFLSVSNDIGRIESFRVDQSHEFVIDLPIYGNFPYHLARGYSAKLLYEELDNIFNKTGPKTFVQWEMINQTSPFNNIGKSEYNMFINLLPGVPVTSLNILDNSGDIKKMRESQSFMHGNFTLNLKEPVILYTRIKSGNPGYLVALNPSSADTEINVEDLHAMPSELTVHLLSENYNITDISVKSKVEAKKIPISKHSAIILTYVPK